MNAFSNTGPLRLSTAQNEAYRYLSTHFEELQTLTMKELAKRSYCTSATLIRLAKKFGYDGFDPFRKALIKHIAYEKALSEIDVNEPVTAKENVNDVAEKMSRLACESIHDTMRLFDSASMMQAVLDLERAEHIYVFAISYSYLQAEEFRLNMLRVGKPVVVEHIPSEMLFQSTIVTPKDVVIFVSYSGERMDLVRIARQMRRRKIRTIAITGYSENPLRKLCDVALFCASRENRYEKVGGFSSEYSKKLILDTLYAYYFSRHFEQAKKRRLDTSRFGEEEKFQD